MEGVIDSILCNLISLTAHSGNQPFHTIYIISNLIVIMSNSAAIYIEVCKQIVLDSYDVFKWAISFSKAGIFLPLLSIFFLERRMIEQKYIDGEYYYFQSIFILF